MSQNRHRQLHMFLYLHLLLCGLCIGANVKLPMRHQVNTASSTHAKRLPGAIIIGVKKAGTRAVLEYLRLHDMVKAAGPEVHFFDRKYGKGFDWYREQMPAAEKDDVVIEKTPKYFVTAEAPLRIKRMNPDVKLIVVVRDPVSRALSEYAQVVSKRPDTIPFDRMAFVHPSVGLVNISWKTIDTGLYDKHVSKWLGTFPRSNMLFVNGENLVHDPVTEVRRLQNFLHLPLQIGPWNFDLSGRFPCLRKLPYAQAHCLGRSKGRKHPRVDRRLLRSLAEFYKPHNERFFRMVGENFTWPTYA